MEFRRGRVDMFQIAKYAARSQQLVNLGVERLLALVNEMMDGEAGNYCVELS